MGIIIHDLTKKGDNFPLCLHSYSNFSLGKTFSIYRLNGNVDNREGGQGLYRFLFLSSC